MRGWAATRDLPVLQLNRSQLKSGHYCTKRLLAEMHPCILCISEGSEASVEFVSLFLGMVQAKMTSAERYLCLWTMSLLRNIHMYFWALLEKEDVMKPMLRNSYLYEEYILNVNNTFISDLKKTYLHILFIILRFLCTIHFELRFFLLIKWL